MQPLRPSWPPASPESSLVLSRDQIRLIDKLAMTRFAIPGLILMENAGRSASQLIDRNYGPGGCAVIVCGGGNNGGDGLVIARHLHNAGWMVRVIMTVPPERLAPDSAANHRIVSAMDIPVEAATDAPGFAAAFASAAPSELVIDALLGTGFEGEVRDPTAEMIRQVNRYARRAVVAIDVPSGLDCDTGRPSTATVRADLTITFVAQKRGFAAESAKPYLGLVEVAEIGAPSELIRAIADGKL